MDAEEMQKMWDELRLYESILARLPGDSHARARVLALRAHLHDSPPPPSLPQHEETRTGRIRTLAQLPGPPPRPKAPDSLGAATLPPPSRRAGAALLDLLFAAGLLSPDEEAASPRQALESRLWRGWRRDPVGYGNLLEGTGLTWSAERPWHPAAPGVFTCREAGALCVAFVNPLDAAMISAVRGLRPEPRLFSCPPGAPHPAIRTSTTGR